MAIPSAAVRGLVAIVFPSPPTAVEGGFLCLNFLVLGGVE